jgi:hypothetical protein
MPITTEYLQGEIKSLEAELQKANVFAIQAQATIAAYNMLINKMREPDAAQEIDQPEGV